MGHRATPVTSASDGANGQPISDIGPASGMYTPHKVEEEPQNPVDQLRVELHRRLIERLDLDALERISDERAAVQQIRNAVGELLRNESTPLSQAERDDVVEQIVYEITGLGPIEPLFRDLSVTDILVNGPKDIYVERQGRLVRALTTFR